MRNVVLALCGASALGLALAGAVVAAPKHRPAAKAAGASAGAPAQVVTGPVADYWMSAATVSGFGAQFSGGGRPSMGAMFGAAMGRNGGPQKTLTLQLGSTQAPSGPPQADHLAPPALGVGATLPLLTPTRPSRARPPRRASRTARASRAGPRASS